MHQGTLEPSVIMWYTSVSRGKTRVNRVSTSVAIYSVSGMLMNSGMLAENQVFFYALSDSFTSF